ncbi:MAG: hypothetical protein OHK006_11820 [Thermodesulfovibrionales bacterium]
MNRGHVKEQLGAYLDAELAAAEMQEVSDHLKTCPVCAAELRDLEEAICRIQELDEISPPSWLKQRVMETVRNEAPQKRGLLSGLFPLFRFSLPAGALAAVLVAAVALVLYKETGREQVKTIQQTEVRQPLPEEPPAPPAPAELPGSAVARKPTAQPLENNGEKKEASSMPAAPAPSPQGERPAPSAATGNEPGPAPVPAETQMRDAAKPLSREDADVRTAPGPARMKQATAGKAALPVVTLFVRADDPAQASQEIVTLLRDLGGREVRVEQQEGRATATAVLPGIQLPELGARLRKIGRVAEKLPESSPDTVSVRITVRGPD